MEINSDFPSEVSGTKGWLATRCAEFLNLLRMIRLQCPVKIIAIQALQLLIYTLIYPIPRVVLGRRKIQNFLTSFSEILKPIIVPFPPPLKSKVITRWFSSFGLFSEIYLEDVYSKETLKKGQNIIDVGANIGVYTILAAEKVSNSGRVIAIEPGPKNYELLIKNIELNNFQNVIPKNIALTDHEGFEKLYLSSSFAGHSLVFQENKNSYINIPVTTIDKLVEELGFKKIDIIKIDAEGAEMPILKGAEKTLKVNPNIKMLIACYHYPSETKEVCQFLNNKGFKTKVSQRGVVMTI